LYILIIIYFRYYDIPINDVRKLINAVDNKKTVFDHPIFISKRLRKLLGIPEPIEELKELKQQIIDLKNTNK